MLKIGDKVAYKRPGIDDKQKTGTIVGVQKQFLWRYCYAVRTARTLDLVEPGDYIVKITEKTDKKEATRKTTTAKQAKSATKAKQTPLKSSRKCAKRKGATESK